MQRPHPASITLIEPETRRTWRLVERATTDRGLSQTKFATIEGNLPSHGEARKRLNALRGKLLDLTPQSA